MHISSSRCSVLLTIFLFWDSVAKITVIYLFGVCSMYRYLDSYKEYEPTYNNSHTGLLYGFLWQLCYRLSMDILQSLYKEYACDPSIWKKCSHKDKPVVEILECKKYQYVEKIAEKKIT